jgi:hypothetical protein
MRIWPIRVKLATGKLTVTYRKLKRGSTARQQWTKLEGDQERMIKACEE